MNISQKLLYHQWLKLKRSPLFGSNILKTVMTTFLVLYFSAIFLGAAIFFNQIVPNFLPDLDPYRVFIAGAIYYFIIDLPSRLILQSFPTLDIKSYLLLPIPKSSLIGHVLGKSLFHFFNLIPLVTFAVYAISCPAGDCVLLWHFNLFAVGMIMVNHFLAYIFSRTSGISVGVIGSYLVGVLIVVFLDYKGYIALFDQFYSWTDIVLQSWLVAAIPMVVGSALWVYLYFTFRDALTIEEKKSKLPAVLSSLDLNWLTPNSIIGQLIRQDLMLIVRTKRARNSIIYGVLFAPLYVLFVFRSPDIDNHFILVVGLFLSGGISFVYLPLLLSWNSTYFDLFLTRKVTIKEVFSAKLLMAISFTIVSFLIGTLIIIFLPHLLYYALSMLMYNLGFSIFIYMLLASFQSKRVDLDKGMMMNYQGQSMWSFLIIFPIFLLPYGLFFLGNLFHAEYGGLLLIATVSLISLALYDRWLNLCVSVFENNKYKISANFRTQK